MSRIRLYRRPLLMSAAASLPLPFLPSLARADTTEARKRFIVWFTPNGYIRDLFIPDGTGPGFEVPPTLAPLAEQGVQEKVSVVSGLQRYDAAYDAFGPHAFMTGGFLTCTRVERNGARASSMSADQIVAPLIRCDGDRFESVRLGLGISERASGETPFSETYLRTISYSPDPMLPQESPQRAFDDFTGGTNPGASSADAQLRLVQRRSVLDFALSRLTSLEQRLSSEDRMRLQAYTTEVRSLEQRLGSLPPTGVPGCGGTRPGNVSGYGPLMDAWIDLQVLALQCGLTNTLTFMTGPAGSHRHYDELGVSGDHHDALSHHQSSNWRSQLAIVERWQVEQFARFLSRLDAVVEADGTTILDKSVVLLGSAISDGNAHDMDSYPLLVAGGAGGALTRTGEHHRFWGEPASRLLLAAMRASGADVSSFAGTSSPFDI